jgi:hypothetical protein
LAEQDRHNGTIGAAHEEFLFLSINEMIAEFSEYEPVLGLPDELGSGVAAGKLLVRFSTTSGTF